MLMSSCVREEPLARLRERVGRVIVPDYRRTFEEFDAVRRREPKRDVRTFERVWHAVKNVGSDAVGAAEGRSGQEPVPSPECFNWCSRDNGHIGDVEGISTLVSPESIRHHAVMIRTLSERLDARCQSPGQQQVVIVELCKPRSVDEPPANLQRVSQACFLENVNAQST